MTAVLWTFLYFFSGPTIEIKIREMVPRLDDEEDFYLAMPNGLAMNQERVFISDQNEHTIVILDKSLKKIGNAGSQGEGPGEINLPIQVEVADDDVVIYDDTRTFHFFDLEGNYQRRFKVLQPVFDFAIAENKIVASVISRKTGGFIYIFDWDGEILYMTPVSMKSRYGNFFQDNRARMSFREGTVHLLQMYEPKIWHLDPESKKVSSTELSFNPLEDPTYQETGYQYCFNAFVVLQDHFLCFYPSMGGVTWCLFTKDGQLEQREFLPIHKGEMNSLMGARTVEQDGNLWLYLLLTQPYDQIVKAGIIVN
jgi:hypothetical protein